MIWLLRMAIGLGWMMGALSLGVVLTSYRPMPAARSQETPGSVRENPGSSRVVFIAYSNPTTWRSTSTSGGYSSGK